MNLKCRLLKAKKKVQLTVELICYVVTAHIFTSTCLFCFGYSQHCEECKLKKSPVNIRYKSHIKVTHYINMGRYKETKGNFSPCFNSTLSILDLKRQEIVKDLSE